MTLREPAYVPYDHSRYKYRLMEEWSVQTSYRGYSISIPFKKVFVTLTESGLLTVKKGYAWDGPSGPTIDTKGFVMASLSHDALYQAMREVHVFCTKSNRKKADKLLRNLCRHWGMSSIRAWYVYHSVRFFGSKHTCP